MDEKINKITAVELTDEQANAVLRIIVDFPEVMPLLAEIGALYFQRYSAGSEYAVQYMTNSEYGIVELFGRFQKYARQNRAVHLAYLTGTGYTGAPVVCYWTEAFVDPVARFKQVDR